MQVVMALDVGIGIGAEDSVRLLLEITEGMDFEGLYAAYDRETRADEATPKQMLVLVVLAFMIGIYSTRGMEAACRNDIRFMYVLGGKRVPDHSRFASFIRDRLGGGVGEDLFYQVVKALHERGEIRYEHLFVDGTKIEANGDGNSEIADSLNRRSAQSGIFSGNPSRPSRLRRWLRLTALAAFLPRAPRILNSLTSSQ